ncbi:MAG: hypothetical protein LUO94_04440 [Methylococcaceae bacterium]|nr:hypothetical protein [Methylococcaceae bacterium]MDD1631780.1 hypothetical protein [Methylococcaceae bacterium]MDD1642811.1 hypothetical protein [Methylococcaceae bacterium]
MAVSASVYIQYRNLIPIPNAVIAVILECDAQKWFKPAKSQFKIYYKDGLNILPNFVAETGDCLLKVETKPQAGMTDSKV